MSDLSELSARIANLEQAQAMIMPLIQSELEKGIGRYVNGKIDKLSTKMDEHIQQHREDMDALLPLLQAAAGGKILYRIFLTIGGVAAGWLALKDTFHF